MSQTYFTIKVVFNDWRADRVFLMHPNGALYDDERTPDEIANAAAEKGFEVTYASNFAPGCFQIYQKAELAARTILRATAHREIEVELCHRLTKYET